MNNSSDDATFLEIVYPPQPCEVSGGLGSPTSAFPSMLGSTDTKLPMLRPVNAGIDGAHRVARGRGSMNRFYQ